MDQLLSAIVVQAVKDLDNEEYESDAVDFFKSAWFETLVEELNLNPVSIKRQVLDRTYERVNIRAGYR